MVECSSSSKLRTTILADNKEIGVMATGDDKAQIRKPHGAGCITIGREYLRYGASASGI